ncbi:bacterio-opsin activator domain-containing protein [Haloferax profundi]|uniref:Bacterio-opsin activator n=1 Tax=Haloferax profundi TaxID=1544718 RepID=A0A0W1S641_9EURY|nr:bacterio-opsin activator domain-containing protein [Haloferax profundi]KTG21472.1 bacterio-opsin activator [Haloferax profundi]
MRRRGGGTSPARDWEEDYARLRRATETYREELVLRLGAEAGLHPGEMSELTPAHVASRAHRTTDLYALATPIDGRTTYLPGEVEHELRKYVTANNIEETERVFPVTARRLQMLVSTVGERAAEQTGYDYLNDISSRDLRRYFARSLLADGVHPSVVMKVGGWSTLESLEPFIHEPTDDEVVDALSGDSDTFDTTSVSDYDERIPTVVDIVTETSDALASASTRTQLEQTTCERLGRSNAYRFALISPEESQTTATRTVVGVDEANVPDILDSVAESLTVEDDGQLLRPTTFRSKTRRGPVEVTAVPVVHGETTYGRLYIGTPIDTVSDRERAVLGTLGRQVGAAITAAERKKILLADTVTQLRLECSDDNDVLVRVSDALGCTCALRGVAPIEDRSLLCFLAFSGVSTEQAFDELDAKPEIANVRLIRDRGDESLLEVVVDRDSLLTAVSAHDGTVSEFVADDGVARFVVELSNETPLRTVVTELTDAYPETELRSKREVEREPQNATDFRESVETRLTDKQHSALRAAYLAGYFGWPRESTAEDLADSLDVSSPTLHQHLRTAQQKMLTSFFDDDRDHSPH